MVVIDGNIPVRCLRIKEICNRNESEADDSPNDPEFPAEVVDAGECDLYDGVVADPICSHCWLLLASFLSTDIC
jgi:hypothetical protein